jgi:hypothetical protein
MMKAPQSILEIKHTNPVPPSDPNWSKSPGHTFPDLAEDVAKEWKQVLAPDDEYDQFTLVGASGWVIQPGDDGEQHWISGADVPFTHPFGFDWEFELALDPQYTSLLSPENKEPGDSDQVNRANQLLIPVAENGFLGVEWDKGHVPQSFQDHVNEGDRVAVFGRWILDTGHSEHGGFRTEIHPPLLMAVGSVQPGSAGSEVTRVLFTSRPYLVGQTFTTEITNIYEDTAGDDGHFYVHFLKELGKVNTVVPVLGLPLLSTFVEAHPKIKSHPFLGAHLLHFVVKPPPLPQPATPGRHVPAGRVGLDLAIAPRRRLAVSFQFTVRTGCAVQVVSTTTDSVDVIIALSHAGYTPPPLPHRTDRTYSRAELAKLDPKAGTAYLDAELLSGAAHLVLGGPVSAGVVAGILNRGIKTDEYAALKNIDILASNHAVTNTFADSIPTGAGVSRDDSQPFPVYGWIDVSWAKSGPELHQ